MKKSDIWEQLAKYFAGELDHENTRKMEKWIAENSEREIEVKRLYQVWKESENPSFDFDVEIAWMKLSEDMKRVEKLVSQTEKEQSKRIDHSNRHVDRPGEVSRKKLYQMRRVWVAAAVIMIMMTAGFLTYFTCESRDEIELAVIEHRIFITENGERAIYLLKDGTRVTLHASSRLEIPDNYNEGSRELKLEGEAYFEVTHDPDNPFIVQSGHTYTRVLGTSFLIQSWNQAGDDVEVIVSDGSVLFGDRRTLETDNVVEATLTRNQRASLGRTDGLVVSDVADLDWYLGWTTGQLVFDNRPLKEIIPRLERWYDLEIVFEDSSILNEGITAEIDYSLPMSDVLQGLAMILELDVIKEGRKVTFK